MLDKYKDQEAILAKLGIEALNSMQESAHEAISEHAELVLLSPTGTGKTLAFLLPIIADLDPELEQVQALVLVPSRELAIQIEQVCREMGSGYKVNAVYGGRAAAKDREDLKHPPAILIGTPGRLADHLRRGTFNVDYISTLVLDEFDKSLEVGFYKEMKEIATAIPFITKKILTSATQQVDIPEFIGVKNPKTLNFLGEGVKKLTLKTVLSENNNKLDVLAQLLLHLGGKSGIVFCNLKDSIQTVSDFLKKEGIDHACFFGGMEQQDRERALIKFRNGTHRILVATDLAARGIDVPEMDFIIHYQLPFKAEEFVHRNGRTARMHQEGTAYILQWQHEVLPEFIQGTEVFEPEINMERYVKEWETLFISGGRKDKVSKGDIAGPFFKQGNLKKDELGMIELKQDCAFVSVPFLKAPKIVKALDNSRLKKKKVRIRVL